MVLYLLMHCRQVEHDAICPKIIGFFSSQDLVEKTIKHYKNIQGFKEHPNDFVVEEFSCIGKTHRNITSGCSVFLLQHEYSAEGYDFVTNVGVFPTRLKAVNEMRKIKRRSSKEWHSPNGFTIAKYVLDKLYWGEGFVSY